jgi:ATP-dependent Lhr-like helicase
LKSIQPPGAVEGVHLAPARSYGLARPSAVPPGALWGGIVLDTFHPLVRRWFERRFGEPTEPQALGWPEIAAGRDVLLSAPTGSGKTLAAFLFAIDELYREALDGRLGPETKVLYVSPLRALGNDVEKNLRTPLAELADLAREEGLPPPDLRVAVRSGDTPSSRRQALVRVPPHILVTTPESLYLLLTTERGRAALRSVQTVIVDEVHAVARDKRGAHLALSLERLEALARRRPQRIGLSATVNPIEEMARFLVGTERVDRGGQPRCAILESGRRRTFDLGIEIPLDELSSVASNDLWRETYDRVAELVRAHRATLVFVNTRRIAERATHALAERLGADEVAAHHGSLSRARRLHAEERLKSGRLRAVVATASLELGIDVGEVDLVVQLGSPGALNVALQRVGRSAHVKGGLPRGRLFPMSRDELVECAAVVRGLRRGALERIAVPDRPLDILAQQLVAEASAEPIHLDRLFALARRAYPYRGLSRAQFDAVVDMLSEGIATSPGRTTALLHRDAVNGRVKGRRGARIAALTGGGAIPDNSQYTVVAEPEGTAVGQVDEDFAVESIAGDVFLLGNTSWRIRRIEAGVVRVEDAHGAAPGIPFWIAEAPGRSRELSAEVSALREELERRLGDPAAAAAWLAETCAVPPAGARQLVEYVAATRAALGAVPSQRTLVAERFFDEAGGMQLVVHAPFGARTNRAFGLALRKRFCRRFDFELQAAATDEGILLSLGPQHSFPLESIFELLSASTVDEVLAQAALQAPMFAVRWRWNATRALAIPRLFKGKRMPAPIARMRADDLLAAVFPQQVACQDNAAGGPVEIPDHPLVAETLRDCLCEAMDAPGLAEVLGRIARGEVRLVAVDTPEPSPMSHEIVGARPWAYLDDAPLEERRARAVALRRALPAAEATGVGALDPAAIAEVAEQIWPVVRDPDELHDALLDLGVLPGAEAERVGPSVAPLLAAGRAAQLRSGGAAWVVAAERVGLARAVAPALATPTSAHPERCAAAGGAESKGTATLDPDLRPLPSERIPADDDAAALAVVRGWAPRVGPFTGPALAARIGLAPDRVRAALARLEAEGLILRGRFLAGEPWSAEEPHWCERSVLARIHRLTLARLRREIEPASAADLLRFLARWQHVAPGTRLHGARGVAEVIGQLQGFHAAAGAWERDLLSARIAGYERALLDDLCLSGEVAWGRLAVAAAPEEVPRRRNAPTRNAAVTLALREDLPWLLAGAAGASPPLGASALALVEVLDRRGASFLSDLAAATGRLPGDVEQALWELVSAGYVTCDGFSGLRALVEPPPRGRPARRPGFAGGRWSLLRSPPEAGGHSPKARALPPETLRSASLAPGQPHPAAPALAGESHAAADDLLERLASQYLRRYGVVFRDLLARESLPPPWRELLRVYRSLEARGAIRGGRFVAGFTGEQFALPEAVDALRAVRRAKRDGAERIEVSAADPLNLVGILTPGARVPAVLGNRVELVDGVPVAAGSAGPPGTRATAG